MRKYNTENTNGACNRVKFGAYRGLYLLGNKAANRIAAVQVLNPDGKSISMPLIEYLRSRIRPDHTTPPWRVDVEFEEEQNKLAQIDRPLAG